MYRKLALFLVLILSMSAVSFAGDRPNNALEYSVTSPEFPNAYIIMNTPRSSNISTSNLDSGDLGTVTATVFVEEQYGTKNGKVVVTESRLLSKKEVDKIGVQNFQALDSQVSAKSATNARGKLTITFSGSYVKSGNSVSCKLAGNATWTGFNFLYNSKDNPAVGEDFIGFAWAGGFSAPTSSASATWNGGGAQNIYLAEAVPNAGRVWEFNEYANVAGKYAIYVNKVNVNATLSKANLEGNGNTAEAVLKYIHTYQSTTGSIDISASSDSVGAGFSLSNTDKQWNISCVVTGFPY